MGNDETQNLLENLEGQNTQLHRLIIQDSDTGPEVFTSESFTITGIEADKFTVKKVGNNWYLSLKNGESFDHESLIDDVLNLQIRVSDGVNVSDPLDVIVNVVDVLENDQFPIEILNDDDINDDGEDEPVLFHGDGGTLIVYKTKVSVDVEGAPVTYVLRGDDADLFTINSSGVVSFKSNAFAAFDTLASFEFTIIAQSGGAEDRKTVTVANNSPPVISSTSSPKGRAIGDEYGPDLPTDPDDEVPEDTEITYYWFAGDSRFRGIGETPTEAELESLVNGNILNSAGNAITPLVGENNRLLTLKREYIEKEIWLVIKITDTDGDTTYHYWAASASEGGGRFDIIGDTRDKAATLVENDNGNLNLRDLSALVIMITSASLRMMIMAL